METSVGCPESQGSVNQEVPATHQWVTGRLLQEFYLPSLILESSQKPRQHKMWGPGHRWVLRKETLPVH